MYFQFVLLHENENKWYRSDPKLIIKADNSTERYNYYRFSPGTA